MGDDASESLQIVVCHSCQKRLKYPPNMAGKRVRCPRCQTLVSLPPLTPLELEQAAILRLENIQVTRAEKLARALVGRLLMGVALLWRLRLPLSAVAVAVGLSVVVWIVATRRAESRLAPVPKPAPSFQELKAKYDYELSELNKLEKMSREFYGRILEYVRISGESKIPQSWNETQARLDEAVSDQRLITEKARLKLEESK